VLQSMAPLQLKRFKVGSKMVIAASTPVLPNQKKQCCKFARFTDATSSTSAIANFSTSHPCSHVDLSCKWHFTNNFIYFHLSLCSSPLL
jgi:hypothetical protein